MLLKILPIFISVYDIVNGAVFNRYTPGFGKLAQVFTSHKTESMKIELLSSFGMSPSMLSTAKQAIVNHFTHNLYMSGIEADQIGEELENAHGGLWAVYNYDINYDIAYTIVRRSPSYALFQVDDRGLLLAKDGYPDPPEGGVNKPLN